MTEINRLNRPKELVCEGLAISRMNDFNSLLRVEYDQAILHPDYEKCPWGRSIIDAKLATVEITEDYFLIKPFKAESIYIKRDTLGWACESRIKAYIESFHGQVREKMDSVYKGTF